MTPFILLIGLGTHALFEGMALGLAQGFKNVEIFGLAILIHKGPAGLALGVSMSKTFPNDRNFVFSMLLMFALFTPIGIILGMFLSESPPLVEVIFSTLAGGTFIYISLSEIIVEEFSKPDWKYLKLFLFFLGIMTIVSLGLIE